MIARHWHGRVPATLAADYLKLMADLALPDYRATEGNLRAWCMHRAEGEVVHVETLTLWRDEAAIRRFAGENLTLAKYYDFDPDYLLELETTVRHYEVIEG